MVMCVSLCISRKVDGFSWRFSEVVHRSNPSIVIYEIVDLSQTFKDNLVTIVSGCRRADSGSSASLTTNGHLCIIPVAGVRDPDT